MNESSFDKDNPILRAALMRGLVSRRIGHDGRRRRRCGGLPGGLRIGGEEPVLLRGRHAGRRRRTAAAAAPTCPTPRSSSTGRTGPSTSTSSDGRQVPADARGLHEEDRHQGQLHRGLPRQRRVLRQGASAARGRQGHRSRRLVQHRLDGRPPDPTGVRAEARPRQHPQRQATSATRSRTSSSTRAGSTRCPWQSGFAGIGYNLKATGGKKVESMTQLLTDPALKGKVTLLTEMRDTVGLVMMEQGKDISKFTDADFTGRDRRAPAGQGRRPDPAASPATSTPRVWPRATSRPVSRGPVTSSSCSSTTRTSSTPCPQKGFTLWSDNFVIPALAKHKKNAEKLIDYYYDPAVMAQVVASVNYISPVKGTEEELTKIDPSSARTRSSCRRPRCCRAPRSSAA